MFESYADFGVIWIGTDLLQHLRCMCVLLLLLLLLLLPAHSKLEFHGCAARVIFPLHLGESAPQVTRHHLSVATSDCLKNSIVDEDVLVL